MGSFVFFGGKGGVGKTTVSSAYAYKCANAGLETLIVSTDPAHSTGDVFDQPLGDEPTSVEGVEGLSAMEIDPDEEVTEHLQEIRRRMNEQVSAGIVNEIDRQIELAHQTPGAYEAALFDRFVRVMREHDDYDRVVFDTSPTGGTLRLLSLPEFLGDWIDRLVEKRAQSIDLFEKAAIGDQEARRRAENDPIIEHLRSRRETFSFAKDVLQSNASFYLVLNPDELSVRETERAVDQLAEYGIDVNGLVVNRVTPEPDPAESGRGATYLRQRCETESERIADVRSSLSPPVEAVIESRVAEVRGDVLQEIAEELGIAVE